MAYDVDMADRLREILANEPGVVEKPVSDDELNRWVKHGVGYARSLPPR